LEGIEGNQAEEWDRFLYNEAERLIVKKMKCACVRGHLMSHLASMYVMSRGFWRWLGSSLLCSIALSGCGTFHPSSSPPCVSVANKSNPPAVDSGVVQSLQRQIGERDKRIAELTSQLDVLKVIDQDMNERRESARPPAILTPSAADQPR
jgi:hypothetical protein